MEKTDQFSYLKPPDLTNCMHKLHPRATFIKSLIQFYCNLQIQATVTQLVVRDWATTSEIRVQIQALPHVEKLVVVCPWSVVYIAEPLRCNSNKGDRQDRYLYRVS